jgi:Sec-independent protein translocase protein TatA
VSLPDIFFIALLGLVIFGPKKLATIAPEAGKMLARWKKMSSDFQSQLAAEVSASATDSPNAAPVAVLTGQRQVVALSAPTSSSVDSVADFVLICNYTGKEVVE